MNTIMYDLTDFCKDMSMKNFREYAWIWEWALQRSNTYKELNKIENIEKFNEWLELKIKDLIRYKKRAEKLLNSRK